MSGVDDVEIRVIESPRRKKTVSARIVGSTIEIRIPEGLRAVDRDRHIQELSTKLLRKRARSEIDITERATRLAEQYGLPQPNSVSWSARQNSRWGSCTPADASIRLSHRLSEFPQWVLDYVIVHELAHLAEPNHSAAFHALVSRFPRAERAEGFLIAVALGHGGPAAGITFGNGDTHDG
jgi:predicted metal-dependent hydrolase